MYKYIYILINITKKPFIQIFFKPNNIEIYIKI